LQGAEEEEEEAKATLAATDALALDVKMSNAVAKSANKYRNKPT
jgi:hypothetical protein